MGSVGYLYPALGYPAMSGFGLKGVQPINNCQHPAKIHQAASVWECRQCHRTISSQQFQEMLKSSFLHCWLLRLSRKGGRDLAGRTLDALLPLPVAWKAKISQWLEPKVVFYEQHCWDYQDLFKRFRVRKPVKLSSYFKRTIINTRIHGALARFYEGQFFTGTARFVILGLTWYDVGKYLYRAYQNPQERKSNLKKCLIQAIKWTIGTEFGNIGFDVGAYIAPNARYLIQTGFLMEALWSAAFDRLLQGCIKPND